MFCADYTANSPTINPFHLNNFYAEKNLDRMIDVLHATLDVERYKISKQQCGSPVNV